MIHKREEKLNEVDKWRRYRCVRKRGNYWWGPQMALQIGTLVNVFDQAVMKLFAIMERVMKMQKFINGGKPLGRTSAGMLSKFELILWILFCWLFSSLESEFALFFKSPYCTRVWEIAEMPALAEPHTKWVWEKEEEKWMVENKGGKAVDKKRSAKSRAWNIKSGVSIVWKVFGYICGETQ